MKKGKIKRSVWLMILSLVLTANSILPGMPMVSTVYAAENEKTITPGTDADKTGTGTMEITLLIKPAPAAPAAPTKASGTAKSIVLSATKGYQYKCGDGEWQDSPEFTGLMPSTEYTFYQRVKETDTTSASESSTGTVISTDADTYAMIITLVIKGIPAATDFDVTIPDKLVYDGKDKPVTVAAKAGISGMGEIAVKYYSGETELTKAPTNAGTYTFKIDVTEGSGYKAVSDLTDDSWTFTIAKAEPAVNAPKAKVLTYTESAQTLVDPGSAEGGTLQYALGTDAAAAPDESLYTTSIPTKTDAGTYCVWYRTSGDDNHQDIEPACIIVNIQKADLTLSVSLGDWEAGTEAPAPVLEGNSGNGGVTYSYAGKGSGDFTDTMPTDAGVYTLKASVAETANYNKAEATCDFTITEAVHQHTFGTNPRWLWRFVDGKVYAEAAYSCDCGETETAAAKVVKELEDNGKITYTATDKYENTDSCSFNMTFTVTYNDENTEYAYGDTCRLTAEEASDWTVTPAAGGSGVVRAEGTKTFYFPVTESVKVAANKKEEAQEQSARIGVLSYEGGQNQFIYRVFWSLPEGAQVKSTMIYRSKDNNSELDTAEKLLAVSTLRSYDMKLNVRNGEYKYKAVNLTSGTKQTVMAQVVYRLNGKTYTIHTDPVSIAIE